MIIRASHRISADMLLKAITEMISRKATSFSKAEILNHLRFQLTEFGSNHYEYWSDNPNLCEAATKNKDQIVRIFNSHWTLKTSSMMDEFFNCCAENGV